MMKYLVYVYILSLAVLHTSFTAADERVKIALLKYKGGGDWYANPTALPNLVEFCNEELYMNLSDEIDEVEAGSLEIFNYPFLHMTGHGNVLFTDDEAENLRTYLLAGGFLHVDDNYGMDKFFRPAIKKVFPDKELVEVPFSHPIYHQSFEFTNGLPKIHEHDGKPAQGFGIFHEGRLMVFYSFESDLGDGWEDPEVHKDPPDVRDAALQMGANIIEFSFVQ